MLRKCSVLAATAALVATSGGTALAVDPVDTAVRTVEKVTAVRVPGGVGVGDGVGGVRGGRSAVVGYISISYNASTGQDGPSYTLMGALADPGQWACAGSGSGASYSVKCVPVPLVLPVAYHCDVLHADISTFTAAGSGRTSLDCDSDGVAEAATATVAGVGGHDSEWALDTRPVTAFTCTIDNAAPDYHGGCGDPGLVGVE